MVSCAAWSRGGSNEMEGKTKRRGRRNEDEKATDRDGDGIDGSNTGDPSQAVA